MIEWLQRVDPDRTFLRTDDRTWSYGQTIEEVEPRLISAPQLIQPSMDPESVFDIIAGVSGGGATIVGPHPEATSCDDAELVVFTSGTTGPPKGVRLYLSNLTAAAAASQQHLGHGAEDDWLLAMPLHHVGGISIVVRQAFTGGAITMLPRFDAKKAAEAMNGPVTMVSVVPTMLSRLLEHGPYSGLRAVLVGGGPIPDGLLGEAAGQGLPVLPTYGMTETFGQVATLRPGSSLERKVHPLPGVELRIDPTGRIAVKGPQVSPGYVGQPNRAGAWLTTNDLGEIDEYGALRVLGRADTVIVTGGEKVDPERVELVVRSHPGVEEAVVVGAPDPEWGQIVVCLFTGDAEHPASWASENLPGHMVPKRWIKAETIPRTPIGKLDRAGALALAEQFTDAGVEGDIENEPDRHSSE